MTPRKERATLRLSQGILKRSGYATYLRLLNHVLLSLEPGDRFVPLLTALRRRDIPTLFVLADSLSVQQYTDAAQHFAANQVALLIKKYPWPIEALNLKPEVNAMNSFLASERRCERVNRKFAILRTHPVRDKFKREGGAARRWIQTVIGSTPNYRRIFDQTDFGKGASVGVHGDATNIMRKVSAESWTVTPGAIHHGYAAVKANAHVFETLCPKSPCGRYYCIDESLAFEAYLSRASVVEYNMLSFVPKTAKTHRVIAVEPLLNGLVQKGIDEELRKRLLRYNLDLRDQGRNQELARRGSVDDSEDGFVTIDLKSASDSISIEIMAYLFPDDWLRLLRRTRSPRYRLQNVEKTFQKFCSMGNGFCFPVETLIFAAACHAVGAGLPYTDFCVYGDDIVVRKRFANPLISLLKHWGFKVNTEKTFLFGPFRESCGTDWFGGEDVRPYTLDHPLESLEECFKFLNLTRLRARSDAFFKSVRYVVLNSIPIDYRFYRPLRGNPETGIDSYGDEYLYSPTCRYLPKERRWAWLELKSNPVLDREILDRCQHEPWLMGVALRGAKPVPFGAHLGLPSVTFRNKKRTEVAWESYASTSNWLPAP